MYDFDICLEDILKTLNVSIGKSNYNHQADFSSFDTKSLHVIDTAIEEIQFELTAEELTHLIFSIKGYYQQLIK